MPDSKALIVLSNREGAWGFYKQTLNGGATEPIITRIKTKPSWASISPDHRWILYYAHDGADPLSPTHIMRVPVSGGLPEDIGEPRGQSMNCPISETSKCVFSEVNQDNQEVIFATWEPQSGVGEQLTRIRRQHADKLRWAVSPNGSRVAISDGSAKLEILSFSDRSVQQINVPGAYLRSWTWAADGKGLFVSTVVQQGARLCYLDLRGRLQSLWEVKGQKVLLITSPAPDAHTIAVAASEDDANIWMMEKF